MRTHVPSWHLATLLCLAVAAVFCSPALAAVGPNGKITYVVNMPDNTTDVWVMDA